MKRYHYFIFLSVLCTSAGLISSNNTSTPQERDFADLTTSFHKHEIKFSVFREQKQCAAVRISLYVTLATMFGYDAAINNESIAASTGIFLFLLYLANQNNKRRSFLHDQEKEFITECAKKFTADELDTLSRKFYELNPRTPMPQNSLLFLARQKQSQIKND